MSITADQVTRIAGSTGNVISLDGAKIGDSKLLPEEETLYDHYGAGSTSVTPYDDTSGSTGATDAQDSDADRTSP